MSLVAAQAIDHLTHALGRPLSSELSPIELINQAGALFCQSHGWTFLLRSSVPINTVASQTFISLPPDFGKAIKLVVKNNFAAEFKWTTLDTLAELRSRLVNSASMNSDWWGVIVYTTALPSVPIVELYPIPQTNGIATFSLFYRAKWARVSNDQIHLSLPDDPAIELAYLQLLRDLAVGYESGGQVSVHALLATWKAGLAYEVAVLSDGQIQPTLGKMRGGAVRTMRGIGPGMFPWSITP